MNSAGFSIRVMKQEKYFLLDGGHDLSRKGTTLLCNKSLCTQNSLNILTFNANKCTTYQY